MFFTEYSFCSSLWLSLLWNIFHHLVIKTITMMLLHIMVLFNERERMNKIPMQSETLYSVKGWLISECYRFVCCKFSKVAQTVSSFPWNWLLCLELMVILLSLTAAVLLSSFPLKERLTEYWECSLLLDFIGEAQKPSKQLALAFRWMLEVQTNKTSKLLSRLHIDSRIRQTFFNTRSMNWQKSWENRSTTKLSVCLGI